MLDVLYHENYSAHVCYLCQLDKLFSNYHTLFDLHSILQKGDDLFKSLNKPMFLPVDDLTHRFLIIKFTLNVDFVNGR